MSVRTFVCAIVVSFLAFGCTQPLSKLSEDDLVQQRAAASSPIATYTIVNHWSGGFQAEIEIRNPGTTALVDWTCRWTYTGNQRIQQFWNASIVQSNSVVVAKPVEWNATIAPGGVIQFGFTAQFNGGNDVPSLSIVTSNEGSGTPRALVDFEPSGRLSYRPDSRGNVVPDYSSIGYRDGEVPIPTVSVKISLTPVALDNRSRIQAAIDELSALPVDSQGFRGALLLKKGEYKVSGPIYVRQSGIVVRGEGWGDSGTRLVDTLTTKNDFIVIQGSSDPKYDSPRAKKIDEPYVPTGARTLRLESGHAFKAGDLVALQRKPKQSWIALIEMDRLSERGGSDWTTSFYTMEYWRKVVAVDGANVTLDAPVVDNIDRSYADGFLIPYSWPGKIERVGIENLRLVSVFADENDEDHGWSAIKFDNVQNGWARGVETRHFGYAAVNLGGNAMNVSVLSCRSIDPVSQTIGGRKYSFNVSGQRNLVKDCYATNGRHDFVTGAAVPGPNAFVDCKAENMKNVSGPHQRWATGVLFDNVVAVGKSIKVENQLASGTGQGWTGAQVMLWNCTAPRIVVQSPPGHVNWAVGCKGVVTSEGTYVDGTAVIESSQVPRSPRSLYQAQLTERLSR